MINLIYKTVLAALNKNQMGKISPAEYNTFLSEVLIKIYAEMFSDFRKLNYRKIRFQDTAGYGNEAFNLKQVIEYYLTSVALTAENERFVMPENIMFIRSIFDENILFEKTDLDTFNILKRSKKMQPTECSGICTLNDGTLQIFPFKEKIEMNYLRMMKLPKWTYTASQGVEMFNPDASDFQDVDMHPSMMSRIFVDVLSLCGLNLQAQQTEQYVNMMKQEKMLAQQ